MSTVFISHNSKDNVFVRKFARDLKVHGVKTWVDEAELQVGDSLIQKIAGAISQVDYLAVILSPNSVTSEWVRREVEIAINTEIHNKKVFVLPILVANCEMPPFLEGRIYADFRDSFQYDSSLKRVLQRLGALHPQPPRQIEEGSSQGEFLIPVHVYSEEADELYVRLGHIPSKEDSQYVNMVYFIEDDVCVDLLIPGAVYGVYDVKRFEDYESETDSYSETLAWLEISFSRIGKTPQEVEQICLDIIQRHNEQLRWLLHFSKPQHQR